MDYTQNGTVKMLHARYGVLCDPFGLDHSVTDICYPHLSLCGANSFFLVRPLGFSSLHVEVYNFIFKLTIIVVLLVIEAKQR